MSSPATSARTPSSRSPRRLALRTLGALLLLAVLLFALALVLQWRLASHVGRVQGAFSGLTHRPTVAGGATNAVNIAVLTTDRARTSVLGTGTTAPRWLPRATHVDSLLLIHFDADRLDAFVVAIPLTTPVNRAGGSPITVAGGLTGAPSLLVATIERLTGVRIDHVAAFQWEGFAELTDHTGDVSVTLSDTVRDPQRDLTWRAGRQVVDGDEALAYVGQRDGLADPVLGQAWRVQSFLRELMDDTLHQEFRKNPFALYWTMDSVSRHLSVDDGWSSNGMRNLAISLRNLRSARIHYLVVPLLPEPTGIDRAADRQLWQSVRADRMEQYVAGRPGTLVPDVVG